MVKKKFFFLLTRKRYKIGKKIIKKTINMLLQSWSKAVQKDHVRKACGGKDTIMNSGVTIKEGKSVRMILQE